VVGGDYAKNLNDFSVSSNDVLEVSCKLKVGEVSIVSVNDAIARPKVRVSKEDTATWVDLVRRDEVQLVSKIFRIRVLSRCSANRRNNITRFDCLEVVVPEQEA